MARVRRVRNVRLVSPAKCERAALRLFDAILSQPETAWRREHYSGDGSLTDFDEYHGRIAWRLAEQGTRYSVEFDETVLRRVFERVRDLESSYSLADRLWTAIIRINANPLPRDIGLALVASGYFARLALANSDQHPDVHWEAARLDKQARNRMATRVMVDDAFGPDDVTRFLALSGRECLLLMSRVRECSEEKRAIVERAFRGAPS